MGNEAELGEALAALKTHNLARIIEVSERAEKAVSIAEGRDESHAESRRKGLLDRLNTWIDILEGREEPNEEVQDCLLKIAGGMPLYVKDLVAQRESDGVVICFVFADMYGRETKWDGVATILIGDDKHQFAPYIDSFTVKKADFKRTAAGAGAAEKKGEMCAVGGIPYEIFTWRPKKHDTGRVKFVFRPDGVLSSTVQLRAEGIVTF